MKKLFSVIGMVFILTSVTFAQESNKVTAKKLNIQIYGFVRSEYYFDSYKGVNAAMDNFYLFPLYKGVDAAGEDINQMGIHNYSAMATRFGFNISGPEILGAKSSANFETDFAGIVSEYPEVLRLRKAFFKLDWENSSLLVGQTWHPLWNGSGAFFPQVASLNTGAPFNPFNRSPQIDFDYKLSKKTTLSLTALYEQQYCSSGMYAVPNTNSKNLPKRNAGIPELVAGLYYNSNGWSAGIAGQFNAIQPIDVTDLGYKTDKLNTSYIGMGYFGYRKDKLFLLAKGLIGQNMVNLTMPGGYGVKEYDSTTGEMEYTDYTDYSTLFNLVYGTEYQIGIFGGVLGSLGTADPLYDFGEEGAKIIGLVPTMKNVYRVSPHFAYNYKNFRFVAEYEMTSADYGKGNFDFSDGLYDGTVNATNNRILLMVMYNF
ncbi:MAG: hypothetical protein J7L95_05060 [Prolixibacteraceae bacterium]|nr:hypothetical protein [Prolixibacteraceae bacterium]